MQDPVTLRFIKSFHYLKEKDIIRSARQFALSIDTYPQSLNEILKGRREVTLSILRKTAEKYRVNPDFLLTGMGRVLKSECEEDRRRGQVTSFESQLAAQRQSIESMNSTLERFLQLQGQAQQVSDNISSSL